MLHSSGLEACCIAEYNLGWEEGSWGGRGGLGGEGLHSATLSMQHRESQEFYIPVWPFMWLWKSICQERNVWKNHFIIEHLLSFAYNLLIFFLRGMGPPFVLLHWTAQRSKVAGVWDQPFSHSVPASSLSLVLLEMADSSSPGQASVWHRRALQH